MFDFSWGELILIGAVALIVIGPKELPGVLRAIGQWTTKIRRMAAEFQSQFQEAMREADMADLKREIDTATHGLTSPLDPLETKEASKWEPKPGEASQSTVQPVDPLSPQASWAHDDNPPEPQTAGAAPPSQSAPHGESGGSAEPAGPGLPAAPAPVPEPANAASPAGSETAEARVPPPAPASTVAVALADAPVPQRSERA
jgi:sec-independent protein translocase protein TatB